jgi:hypothetical protein
MDVGMHGRGSRMAQAADAAACPVNPFELRVQSREDDLWSRFPAGRVFRVRAASCSS